MSRSTPIGSRHPEFIDELAGAMRIAEYERKIAELKRIAPAVSDDKS